MDSEFEWNHFADAHVLPHRHTEGFEHESLSIFVVVVLGKRRGHRATSARSWLR